MSRNSHLQAKVWAKAFCWSCGTFSFSACGTKHLPLDLSFVGRDRQRLHGGSQVVQARMRVARCKRVGRMPGHVLVLARGDAGLTRAGVSPEEFLHRRVDEWLDRPDEEFKRAAT